VWQHKLRSKRTDLGRNSLLCVRQAVSNTFAFFNGMVRSRRCSFFDTLMVCVRIRELIAREAKGRDANQTQTNE
jgi:hypothetical protein